MIDWISAQEVSTARLIRSTVGGIAPFVVSVLLVGGAIVASIAMRRPKKRQHEAQIADWQIASEKWNDLYYCARDDLVFDPVLSLSFAPEAMDSYLVNFVQGYRQQTQPAIDVTPPQDLAASSVASSLSQGGAGIPYKDTQTNAEKFQLATEELKAGKKMVAYLIGHEMLANDSEDYQAWIILAQAAPTKEEAIKNLEKALELKPDDERIKKYLADLRG